MLHLIRELVSSMGWAGQMQSADGRLAGELGEQKVPGFETQLRCCVLCWQGLILVLGEHLEGML